MCIRDRDIPRSTRCSHRHGNRRDSIRIHPPVNHAQVRSLKNFCLALYTQTTDFDHLLRIYRYWKARNTCPKCKYKWTEDLRTSVLNLRKVDFFWINRDQRSFEWFVNLLSQLEIEQAEMGGAMDRFLDMHMYITSALQKTDMKAVGLQLALDLLHKKVS